MAAKNNFSKSGGNLTGIRVDGLNLSRLVSPGKSASTPPLLNLSSSSKPPKDIRLCP